MTYAYIKYMLLPFFGSLDRVAGRMCRFFYQMSRVTYFFPIESAKLDPSDIAYRMDTTQYLPSPSRNFHQIYHNSYHRAAKNFLFFLCLSCSLIGTRFLHLLRAFALFLGNRIAIVFSCSLNISLAWCVFFFRDGYCFFFGFSYTINIAVLMHVLFL